MRSGGMGRGLGLVAVLLLGLAACQAPPVAPRIPGPSASVSTAQGAPSPSQPGPAARPLAAPEGHGRGGEEGGADPQTMLDAIDEPAASQELQALRERLAFPQGLFFPLVLVLGWIVSRAIQRATRFVLRLGLERRRLITITGALLSAGAWGSAFVAIAVRLLDAAPTLTLGVLTLLALVAVLVLRRQLEDLAAGLALAVRSRLREGDRIAIGDHQGVVRRVGFTRVELGQADGSRLYLPNRLVSTEVVAIGPARYSVPLTVSLDRAKPWTAEEILRARQLAGLSPYRDPAGRVVVQTEGGVEHRLTVQIQVWSPRLAAAAEQHLRRQLDRHVAHRPGMAADGDRRQSERRLHERRGL